MLFTSFADWEDENEDEIADLWGCYDYYLRIVRAYEITS